jgi:PEP-CTERM motif
MKKALLALALVAASASSAFAQGTIDFINRNIGTIADPGVLYNVPIYTQGGRATGTGAGNLPGGVTVGLFLAGAADSATPIVSSLLRTGTAVQSQFFATTSQTATIPSIGAGARADLLVRAWQGTSFATAKGGAGQYGEWAFTSAPLGGTPAGGGLPIPTPGMTGWGPENGTGLELVPEPSTIALGVLGLGALLLRRRK